MARPKRIDLPFSLYHVFSRTNTGDLAFNDARDEQKFLSYVNKYSDIFSYKVHAWCLMPTHFHLLLESTNRAALSEFMRRLLTAYTVFFNRRHKRHGHLFQGRFKSYIVEKANYLLALSRYIHLNPVHSRRSAEPVKFRGSSLRYYIDGGEPAFLYTKEILGYFKGSRKSYELFIREGLTQETKIPIFAQSFVGDNEFARRIRKRLGYLEKKGSRSQKAQEMQRLKIVEQDTRKAEEIVKKVSVHFEMSPEIIKKSLKVRGKIGKARAVAVVLMREHITWTCMKITKYLGLKGKRGISYYGVRVRREKDLDYIVKIVDEEIKRGK